MIIEIHQPRLEELIQLRMESGHFESVEDLLIHTLETLTPQEEVNPSHRVPKERKQNLSDFMLESPLHGSGLIIEKIKDFPRPIEDFTGLGRDIPNPWDLHPQLLISSNRIHNTPTQSEPPPSPASSTASSA